MVISIPVQLVPGALALDYATIATLVFDIHTNTPDTLDRKVSKFIYPDAGHGITGNLKVISDSRIHSIIAKGPKYRFPNRIDFKYYKHEIAPSLSDFGNHRYKRVYVESDALKK